MTGVSIFDAPRRCASGRATWSASTRRWPKLIAESMRAAVQQPGAPGVHGHGRRTDVHLLAVARQRAPRRGQPFAAVLLRCHARLRRANSAPWRSCMRWCARRSSSWRASCMNREQISHPARLARRAGQRPGHAAVGQRRWRRRTTSGGGDELKAILRAAIEHIQGGLAAIIVPDKGLVMVRREPEHADRRQPGRARPPPPDVDGAAAPRSGDRQPACSSRPATRPTPIGFCPARSRAPTARHRRAGAVSAADRCPNSRRTRRGSPSCWRGAWPP